MAEFLVLHDARDREIWINFAQIVAIEDDSETACSHIALAAEIVRADATTTRVIRVRETREEIERMLPGEP